MISLYLSGYITISNDFLFYFGIYSRQVLEKCENSYLSNSLTRLLDPAQSMFSNEGEVPSHDQIDSLIRVISRYL